MIDISSNINNSEFQTIAFGYQISIAHDRYFIKYLLPIDIKYLLLMIDVSSNINNSEFQKTYGLYYYIAYISKISIYFNSNNICKLLTI